MGTVRYCTPFESLGCGVFVRLNSREDEYILIFPGAPIVGDSLPCSVSIIFTGSVHCEFKLLLSINLLSVAIFWAADKLYGSAFPGPLPFLAHGLSGDPPGGSDGSICGSVNTCASLGGRRI